MKRRQYHLPVLRQTALSKVPEEMEAAPSCNTALKASADAAKGHDQYLAVSTRERLFTVSQDCSLSKPADRYTLSYTATHDKDDNTGKAFPILYTAHRHPKNAPVCTSTLKDITRHALPLPVTAVTLIPDKKESGQMNRPPKVGPKNLTLGGRFFMVKYSTEFKLKVVTAYLNGE
ncbi:hypothetical protein, partial [Megasphaera massiliensis]